MEKKRMIQTVMAVILLTILTVGAAMGECRPLTGYPTIDAWILAGCRNEQQYYGNGYGNDGYGYNSGYGNGYGNDGYGYNSGYSYQGGGTTSRGGSRHRVVITIPVPSPPRWRR